MLSIWSEWSWIAVVATKFQSVRYNAKNVLYKVKYFEPLYVIFRMFHSSERRFFGTRIRYNRSLTVATVNQQRI